MVVQATEPEYFTVYEVAALFRCGHRKVARVATAAGIGVQLGGSAGWRFSAADIAALRDAMRPKPAGTTTGEAGPTSIGSASPASHRKTRRGKGA